MGSEVRVRWLCEERVQASELRHVLSGFIEGVAGSSSLSDARASIIKDLSVLLHTSDHTLRVIGQRGL